MPAPKRRTTATKTAEVTYIYTSPSPKNKVVRYDNKEAPTRAIYLPNATVEKWDHPVAIEVTFKPTSS